MASKRLQRQTVRPYIPHVVIGKLRANNRRDHGRLNEGPLKLLGEKNGSHTIGILFL